MSTFVLIWDATDAGFAPERYRSDIAATAAGRTVRGRWSFGSRRRGTASGDRVFLLRQRRDRGIVGSGRLADGLIVPGPHWTGDPRRRTWYAGVVWDRMLPVADRLPLEDLLGLVPGHDWRHIYGGGQEVRRPADADLERVWAEHLADVT